MGIHLFPPEQRLPKILCADCELLHIIRNSNCKYLDFKDDFDKIAFRLNESSAVKGKQAHTAIC